MSITKTQANLKVIVGKAKAETIKPDIVEGNIVMDMKNQILSTKDDNTGNIVDIANYTKVVNNNDGTATITTEQQDITVGHTDDEVFEYIRKSNNAQQLFKEITINLRDKDTETMYPVKWQFGSPTGEVIAFREFQWDAELAVDANGNRVSQSERFSDGYSTKYHVAGLTIRLFGGDHPWGGNRPHGVKVMYDSRSYMPTAQLYDTHRIRCYFQEVDDTVFDQDTTVRPPDDSSNVAGSTGGGGTPMWSGMYLRGGLHYKLYYRNLLHDNAPVVITEPTLIFKNDSYKRSEWLAPFKYDRANNSNTIEDIGGLA